MSGPLRGGVRRMFDLPPVEHSHRPPEQAKIREYVGDRESTESKTTQVSGKVTPEIRMTKPMQDAMTRELKEAASIIGHQATSEGVFKALNDVIHAFFAESPEAIQQQEKLQHLADKKNKLIEQRANAFEPTEDSLKSFDEDIGRLDQET